MWGVIFVVVIIKLAGSIRIVPTQSAFIVERLGRYDKTLQPGFHLLVPFVETVAFVQSLKEEAVDVPPQECFTRDNVQVEVDGVLYMQVTDAVNASYGVTDYQYAAIQLAQTTTRAVIGLLELDRTFEERDEINSRVVKVLQEVEHQWGLKVKRFEVKNIVPPQSVKDSMEKQLAPAGGRASDPAAVRRHAAEDLGATGPGRLTRGECNEARLTKKGHKCGAVSEECPESRGSSRSHVSAG